jgi:hypothetical protein
MLVIRADNPRFLAFPIEEMHAALTKDGYWIGKVTILSCQKNGLAVSFDSPSNFCSWLNRIYFGLFEGNKRVGLLQSLMKLSFYVISHVTFCEINTLQNMATDLLK